ncbi:MAG: hypothetical protein IPG32_07825 [Saprospirales bacterium]|nr:hypothetical protein [Saprospirales bacterium]
MVKSLLRWGNVLLIVLTLLVYLAPQVNPLTFWPMAFLGPLFPGSFYCTWGSSCFGSQCGRPTF